MFKNTIRAGDSRSLEGLEMAFYCTVVGFVTEYNRAVTMRAGDSRSLEGLEMAFYCTAKTVRGGHIKPSGFYSLHILDSKNTFGISGPLGEKLGQGLLYNIPDFEGNFDQYFAYNSKTILDMKLIFFLFCRYIYFL